MSARNRNAVAMPTFAPKFVKQDVNVQKVSVWLYFFFELSKILNPVLGYLRNDSGDCVKEGDCEIPK